jgi:hypothetical protein
MMVGEFVESSRTGGNRMPVPSGETMVLCRTRLAFRDILPAGYFAIQVEES